MLTTFFVNIAIILISLFIYRRYPLKMQLLSPPVIVSIFIILYCVIGVLLFWKGDYYFLGFDYKDAIEQTYNIISVFAIMFALTNFLRHKTIPIGKLKSFSLKYFSTYYDWFC